LYVRYSTLHPRNRTFFGLRDVDLKWLEGHRSLLCLLWDGQVAPLVLPFSEFEDVFAGLSPAADGQFKVQVYPEPSSTDFYIANAGRFNVDAYFGWNELNSPVETASTLRARTLTHSQVQTMLGAIGSAKGNDVWCPQYDRPLLDWSVTPPFALTDTLPPHLASIVAVLSEVDVIWLQRGANKLVSLFEVEHTTSISSGLLRFNDVFLSDPLLQPRFTIVAGDTRRSTFVRQVRRPTFMRSGLADSCTFMEYDNVIEWHERLIPSK